MKKIYFPIDVNNCHSMYKNIIKNPVKGWKYITRNDKKTSNTKLENIYYDNSLIRKIYNIYSRSISFFIPPKLILGIIEHLRNKDKINECDMIFSTNGMPVFAKKPWITDFETVHTSFIGDSVAQSFSLKIHKRYIENLLSSNYCKKIIPYFEVSKKNMLLTLNCQNFKHKIETVYLGIKSKKVYKDYSNKIINILFIDSGNTGYEGQFYFKGGEEAVLTYFELRKKFDNINLIIRSSKIPKKIKEIIKGKKDIKIIEERLSDTELEKLYLNSDILFLPYFTVSSSVFLEGMNYKLPIVTCDGWGNSEFVEHGKNGFVISKSRYFSAYDNNYALKNDNMKRHKIDSRQIIQYKYYLSKLIEDKNLRKKMGTNGKSLVEPKGKFSIETRQKKLKQIFDEAIL